VSDDCAAKVDPTNRRSRQRDDQGKDGQHRGCERRRQSRDRQAGPGQLVHDDGEIKMGKQYADEIEKSTKFITDPEVVEYVNRIGRTL